jgi:hypothetical protein
MRRLPAARLENKKAAPVRSGFDNNGRMALRKNPVQQASQPDTGL